MRIEIVQPGFVGKTVYVFDGEYVKKPGLFGETVYKVRHDSIYKAGFLGKELYRIRGNEIKEAKLFGKTVYTITEDAVYEGRNLLYKLKRDGAEEKRNEPVELKFEVKVERLPDTTPFDNVPYNETMAYCMFLNKYKTIKHPSNMKENEYARFMFLKAGVTDIVKLHKELVDKGYYRTASVGESLEIYKVGEIQNIAQQLGIAVKGKKDEIIKTIAKSTTAEQLGTVLADKILSVSEEGLQYLEDNKIDMEYYASGDTSITLEDYRAKRQKFSSNDMQWQQLQKELKNDSRGYGRNAYWGMGTLLKAENKNKEALLHYLKVLYLDVNGIENYTEWKRLGYLKDLLEDVFIAIAPGVAKAIRELKEHYSEDLIDRVYELNLPFMPCEKPDFMKIVAAIINNDLDYKGTEKKLLEEYKRKAKTKR